MFDYIRLNKAYLAEIGSLEDDLIKTNGIIEELRLIITKQTEAIIDLSTANSSAELVGSTLESREFEVTKWQNKYVDLVNRSLDKVPVFKEDDRIEAGLETDKEPITQRTPWHVRRRQLENDDKKKANEIRAAAEYALTNKPPSVETLTEAAKELEADFKAREQG